MKNVVFDKKDILIGEDDIYQIDILFDVEPTEDPLLFKVDIDAEKLNKDTAYIYDNYFFILRGEKDFSTLGADTILRPGLYINTSTSTNDNEVILIMPSDEIDMKKFIYSDKISRISDTKSFIDYINTTDNIIEPLSESSKTFIPPITKKDDILKRAIKQAILEKEFDIDNNKAGFKDKNALFNFKQVVKSEDEKVKVSMLIFQRGMDAMGLEYDIIIRENNPDRAIGKALIMPIKVSSDDTFEI